MIWKTRWGQHAHNFCEFVDSDSAPCRLTEDEAARLVEGHELHAWQPPGDGDNGLVPWDEIAPYIPRLDR